MTRRRTSKNWIWAGSYTADANGRGDGIALLTMEGDQAEVLRTWPSNSPSFIAQDPSGRFLFTANEFSGIVTSHHITPDRELIELDTAPGGDLVCHVQVSPCARWLISTAWGDGSVRLHSVTNDGQFATTAQADPAVDRPQPSGQATRKSRAHASLFLGPTTFATTDLGLDLIRIFQITPDGRPEELQTIRLPAGSGPRHMVLDRAGRIMANTQTSVEVAVLEPTSRGYELRVIVPVLGAGPAHGDKASEIVASPDGRYLYVAVRGTDRIAVLTQGPEPHTLAEFPSGGRTPRHMLLINGRLWVAHQDSDVISIHTVDSATGQPESAPATLELGSPTVLMTARI